MILLIVSAGIIFLVFVGVVLYLAVLIDLVAGKEDFATGKLVANQIIQIIKDRKLDNGNFYDLGSCRGEFASKIAKACPNLKVYGIDDSWFRTLLARRRAVFLKKLTFQRKNIFTVDVSLADIVYVYLPQELMPKLQDKLQKKLKPGALAITYRVSFGQWTPEQVLAIGSQNSEREKLFVYLKN